MRSLFEFHCECGRFGCSKMLKSDLTFYQRHSHDNYFLVAAQHARPGDKMITPKIYQHVLGNTLDSK